MKRIAAWFLVLCMCLGMCACAATATEPVEETASAAQKALDGKKVIFIGNSHTYVGNVVTQTYNSIYQQEKRSNNMGFFYQLCKRQGCEVAVTNWTFSSHGLSSIFGDSCQTKGDCYGIDHKEYLTDRYFDYVVIQPGVGQSSEENIAEDIANVVAFFKEANPDVKFALLGNTSVYGNNSNGKTYPGITSYYKTLAEQGFIMADWGKLVNDLIREEVTPEGATITYNKSSFIIKDGFHPNFLSGYIASVMLFCAITGEKAADIPTDMFQENAMDIMLENHLVNSYSNGQHDSNFKAVLTAESELLGIHKLIDQYLAEKPYLQ